MTTKTITRKPIKCIQWTGENNGEVLDFIMTRFYPRSIDFRFEESANGPPRIYFEYEIGYVEQAKFFQKNKWIDDQGNVLTTEEKERLYEES